MTTAHPSFEPSWLSVMREAYARAQFSEAVAIYDSRGAAAESIPEAVLMRGRILLKTSASEAIDFLLERRERLQDRSSDRYRLTLYLGMAYSRLRDFSVADQRFDEATALATQVYGNCSEVAYHRGLRFLVEGRIGDAWSRYEETTTDRTDAGLVRSEDLKGHIYAFAQRYVEQSNSLVELLSLINRNRQAHLEEWYCAVHNLAALARERVDHRAYEIAMEEISRPEEWAPYYYTQRLQALRSLGWCKALRGDSLGCFRFLREAQNVAEAIPGGKAWRTMVLLDRAHFAMLAGETQWTNDELSAAADLARTVNWEHTAGEERVALLLFAELFAGRDSEKARLFLARFRSLNDLRSPVHFFSYDDRLAALADLVAGLVFLEDGQKSEAEQNLKAAWSTFDRIGYDWRAGKAALALFRATGKMRWQLLAAEKLEAYPQSWLYHQLQDLGTESVRNPTLTPMQRRVLDLLCDGFSTDEISTQLGRSPNTVRNHIKLLFKAYDVRSRTSLISQSRRRK